MGLLLLSAAGSASAGSLDGVRREVLDNGLTVLLLPEPGSPFVSLRRIREILEDAARGAFTEADLAEAKAYLKGKAARGREGARATARTLAEADAGSPDRLTLAQLNDTARRLFAKGAPLALVGGPGY